MARWTAASAAPSATPGARLNDTVTAGNWPWWVMVKGCVVSAIVAIASIGTALDRCAAAGAIAAEPEPRPADGASAVGSGPRISAGAVGMYSGMVVGAVVPAAAELAAAAEPAPG